DVLLLIEASDTSLRKDREVKLPRYAAAGVPEYWIADLERETITVHREPAGERYNRVVTLAASQTVSPLVLPEFRYSVADLYA
ncbi:MAG: Uma2 family endonuclease, partial [Anaerolineae bacterium]|nr:Uma2 family endonuclease [Anaerolineae bacterium]